MNAQLLIVSAGAYRLALPVASVIEIVERGAVTPLPGLPPAMAGVISSRGRAIPLIDVAAARGDEPCLDRRCVIIAMAGARPVALLVDLAEEIADDGSVEVMLLDPATLLEGCEVVGRVG